MDGNTQNSKNYTDDAPYHLTEIRIYSNHAAQWQQKRNSIEIDLHIGSLHTEHGSLKYLQTGGKQCRWQIKKIDKYCQTETADKHLDSDSDLQGTEG